MGPAFFFFFPLFGVKIKTELNYDSPLSLCCFWHHAQI